jgi:glucose/arabinose dehydrogenase
MYVTAPAGDPDRVFVVEQAGTVVVAKNGATLPEPFLDVSAFVTAARAGLTSIAFAPDYATSGRVYVLYTAPHPPTDPANGIDVVVDELTRSAGDPNRVDPASRREVLRLDFDGTEDHDADHLAFGPDGLLYITIGEGKLDFNLSQDPNEPRGKVLRIDPRPPGGGEEYRIPPGNPFADGVDGMPEVFVYGLRNPWRFSFDPAARELLIADVGDGMREEIDAIGIDGGGDNLGWPCREGTQPHNTDGPCTAPEPASLPPVFEYDHSLGRCSIIGGYVVRDPSLPTLAGKYVYGDFCTGEIRALRRGFGSGDAPSGVSVPAFGLSSFGEDGCGHLYAVHYSGDSVYRVDDGAFVPCSPAPPAAAPPAPPGDQPASDPTPGKPGPAPDTTGPLLRLGGAPAQRALRKRRVLVSARCDESCDFTATGLLRRPPGGSVPEVRRATRKAAAGTRVTLELRLKARAVRALRRLLRGGGRGLIRVRVVARDDAGNRTAATRHIAIVR